VCRLPNVRHHPSIGSHNEKVGLNHQFLKRSKTIVDCNGNLKALKRSYFLGLFIFVVLAATSITFDMKIWSHRAPFLPILETYKKFTPVARLFCMGILNMCLIQN
jgi:hypothetical protein